MARDQMPADDPHIRPEGADDATVEAVGKLTEALEWVERARGDLYDFHQKMGHADLTIGKAADALEEAGHAEVAERIRTELVGRNTIVGRWTFQIVEEFDDGYWSDVRAGEKRVRDELLDGRRHVFESEMKEDRRTHGRKDHESRP
ncbi:hypothetical protein PO878_01480 [Iamia majanohamensis]|uniref:Uncharacterized protein n=1 Tax=Iamia majanohamensis TaxID=467976 RepID=A0AAF0BVT5_9ACTN|nr:hypothetical protein [Iamia majanohamensis]WCO67388.1 hypothetical protein PO878_01480 [Iamia majanohamensis]